MASLATYLGRVLKFPVKTTRCWRHGDARPGGVRLSDGAALIVTVTNNSISLLRPVCDNSNNNCDVITVTSAPQADCRNSISSLLNVEQQFRVCGPVACFAGSGVIAVVAGATGDEFSQ